MAEIDIDSSLKTNQTAAEAYNDFNVDRAGLYENTMNERMQNNNNIYRHENFDVYIKDVMTGQTIPYMSTLDPIRMARAGNNPEDDASLVYKHNISSSTLGQMRVNSSDHFNARSCVEALGLYTTTYIKEQVMNMGDKNSDLGAMEDRTAVNNMTFRNYLKTGTMQDAAGQPVIKMNSEDKKDYERVPANLGIGLGEAFVLNPVFQFNKRDDPRTNPVYTKIGRVYSTRVMNNWPIALFQPGRLKYNTGFMKLIGLFGGAGPNEAYIRSGGEGIMGVISTFLTTLTDIGATIGAIGSAVFGGSKLVEFRQAIKLFNVYYRSFLISLSQMMGLWHNNPDGKYVYGGHVDDLQIWNMLPTLHMNGFFSRFLNAQFIPFRCQKGMIGSETFSNNTEENPLMEEMNSQATQNDDTVSQGSVGSWIQDKLKGVLGQFSDKAAVLAGNGRITLPNVYSSSSFSRSFNCDFEFHYPYGDVLGKFENLYIPLITLLTMGLPRQTGKLVYTSPFAVRVFVKNHIMINFGLIQSISVTRGGDSNDWGPDGYPKTLKVTVTIQDMEPNISLPLSARGPLRWGLETLFPASGFSEYLATLGGLEIDQLLSNSKDGSFKRAMNVFRSSWSAKLNPDNMLASIVNCRPIASIMSYFRATDMESINRAGDLNRIWQDNANEALSNPMAFSPESFHSMMDLGGATKVNKDSQAGETQVKQAIDAESNPAFRNNSRNGSSGSF